MITAKLFSKFGRRRAMSKKGIEGFLKGISLSGFLQLLEHEKITCTLRVSSSAGSGLLFIRNGKLFGAETGDKKDLDAALRILSVDDPEIELNAACPAKVNHINQSMNSVLLEAHRLKDEEKMRPVAEIIVDQGLALTPDKGN